jgi:hypothetical protein
LNKKKDSRDPYSFSAFLTAKDVTIPGDDAGSRTMMMQFLNEYLAQVTPRCAPFHLFEPRLAKVAPIPWLSIAAILHSGMSGVV